MPRTPRNSPNPPGRPKKTRQAAAALARAAKTGESIEEAAGKVGVAPATVHAYKRAKSGQASPCPALGSSTPPAGSQATELPQGGAVSGKPDLLELVRKILDARNPAARAELDEGLRVQARGDVESFEGWLARPPEVPEFAGDELEALGGVLNDLRALLGRAGPDAGPRIAIVKALDGVSKSLSVIKTRRKPEPKPDEVQQAVRGQMATCVEHLLRHTREAAAQLVIDRQELHALLAQEVRPVALPEIARRLDAALGAA